MRRFEWDAEKAAINLLGHGVSFEEARTVWRDPFAMWGFDAAHSIEEDRFWVIG